MNSPSPQSQLLTANVRLAERVAARLEASMARLAALFPLGAGRLSTLRDEEQERLDAFLKRFEQLTDLLQARLFRAVVALEGEDVGALSRRDVALVLERIGALASADEWAEIVLLRNVLSHEYPEEEARQAERLNMAFLKGRQLVATLRTLRGYAERKGLPP